MWSPSSARRRERMPLPGGSRQDSFPRAGGIPLKAKEFFYLLLLTAGAFLVHGYHPYAEDSEFYVSAIKKLLNPALYPVGQEIFQRQASLTLFPQLIVAAVRLSHLPLETVLLAGHLLSYFLFLLGCRKLSRLCFEGEPARWFAVALVAALLTIPVAGTALFLMDQYLNPRSISSLTLLFAVAAALEKRYARVAAWLVVTALVHPLMAVLGMVYVLLLASQGNLQAKFAAAAALFGIDLLFQPPTAAYDQAVLRHSYLLVNRWAWYEWLGIICPLGLLYWFQRIGGSRRMANVARLSSSLVAFLLLSLAGALLLGIPHRFETLARVQPMRSLQLAYVLMLLIAGGLAGEFVVKRSAWRWLLLLVPLSAAMAYVQFQLFPVSAHIEWPGAAPRNQWVQAFLWIRQNTPADAYFALDPKYTKRAGEEVQAFQPIAERGAMLDAVKDSGSVTLFPELAQNWWEQVSALQEWKRFRISEFQDIHRRFGVTWVVVEQPGVPGLECPYQNQTVRVCPIPQFEGPGSAAHALGPRVASVSD